MPMYLRQNIRLRHSWWIAINSRIPSKLNRNKKKWEESSRRLLAYCIFFLFFKSSEIKKSFTETIVIDPIRPPRPMRFKISGRVIDCRLRGRGFPRRSKETGWGINVDSVGRTDVRINIYESRRVVTISVLILMREIMARHTRAYLGFDAFARPPR